MPALPGPEERLSRVLVPLLQSSRACPCPRGSIWLWLAMAEGRSLERAAKLPGVWAVFIPGLSIYPSLYPLLGGGWVLLLPGVWCHVHHLMLPFMAWPP